LDAGKSEKKVWLVKVPNFVGKRWLAACDESANGPSNRGVELGEVRIDMSGAAASNCTLSLKGPTAENLPKTYTLRKAKEASHVHSFGEDPDVVTIGGRVDQRFDAEMQAAPGKESSELDPEYRRISRERNRVAATKTRTAQVIDSRSVNAKTAYTQTYANKCKVEGREKKIVEKRVRQDKQPLESRLFSLFEEQDYWSFQKLVERTDQPVAWLKECLMEIAVQNKATGRHRDHWQLKKEYRTREPVDLEA